MGRLLTASVLGLAACAAPREAPPTAAPQGTPPSAARTSNALVDQDQARARVESVLDDFHGAASMADGERYFDLLAPDAVFYGTDPNERWTTAEFRGYAEPYFSEGRGWTYVPTERTVYLDDDGDVAWFDERLLNAKYGAVRGTGVLVLRDGAWRIVQYNLSFPVPNDVVGELRELARKYAPVGTDLVISGDEVAFTVTASPVEPAVRLGRGVPHPRGARRARPPGARAPGGARPRPGNGDHLHGRARLRARRGGGGRGVLPGEPGVLLPGPGAAHLRGLSCALRGRRSRCRAGCSGAAGSSHSASWRSWDATSCLARAQSRSSSKARLDRNSA